MTTKQFNICPHRIGVGKHRHTVSFHDGISTHRDGSAFFDMRLFRNKRDLAAFVAKLRSEGYVAKQWSAA